MTSAADAVGDNLTDYVRTLDPNEAVRELSCVLSAVCNLGEQLKRGSDPLVTGSVLIILSGVAEGMVEQISTKPGGTAAAPRDRDGMCATQLVSAQLATLGPAYGG